MSPDLRPQRIQQGFTLVELAVIVILIGLIAGLVLPSLAKSRLKVRAQESLEYGRHLGNAFQQYATDNNGRLVPLAEQGRGWDELLAIDNESAMPVPRGTIGYNQSLATVKRVGGIRNPSLTVMFGDTGKIENPTEKQPDLWREDPRKIKQPKSLTFDTPADAGWAAGENRMVNRHLGRSTAIFADGSATLTPVSAVGFQYESGHARALWDNE